MAHTGRLLKGCPARQRAPSHHDHCAACKHGFAPRDAELGAAGTSLSPGLAVMNDKAAAAGPFAGAAPLLDDLAGIRLTAKRVKRAAEANGAACKLQARERAALIAGRKLVPLPPQPVPDMLYILPDGTGVPMTAKETTGREGKGEDGRARTREVKLAVFFNQHELGASTGTRAGPGTRACPGVRPSGPSAPGVTYWSSAPNDQDAELPVNRGDYGMSFNLMKNMASLHNVITIHAVFTRA